MSFALILILLVPTGCVPEGNSANTTDDTNPSTNTERITALETKISQLQAKIASLPTASGNYDDDIIALQEDIDNLYDQLSEVLDDIDIRLAEWEDEQATNSTSATAETTKWTPEVWVDEAKVDVYLQCRQIEDEDDYTLSLYFTNNNRLTINQRGTHTNRLTITGIPLGYLYFETDTFTLWKVTQITPTLTWTATTFLSIYSTVQINEITVVFIPKSSDRVIVDDSKTSLDSISSPFLDWDTEVKNRNDNTCKRIEATTFTRLTLPIPVSFYNNDPEQPVPTELRLDFGLVYK